MHASISNNDNDDDNNTLEMKAKRSEGTQTDRKQKYSLKDVLRIAE